MHLRNEQRHVVHEAPGPPLARLERANQRVVAAAGVGACMTIGGVIAAADLAALQADAQVQPRVVRE